MGGVAGVAGVIPADIAAKLAKLLPRLGSEHEGEVVATVRAIDRILTAAGLDWHSLSAAIEASVGRTRPFDLSTFVDGVAQAAQETATRGNTYKVPDAQQKSKP